MHIKSELESGASKVLVTVAPPTPNGDLHLGHLSGPYIASDVYHRFLRSLGKQSYFVSGSDDNQSYVPLKGKKLGKTPEEVVEQFARSIPATLHKAEIKLDYFLRPIRTPEYVAFVQAFFNRLVADKKLERRTSPALFCETCQLYLYEAHVRGNCPNCAEGTNGNGCEKCGFVNDCIDLSDPRCNHCDARPAERAFERFYFPLDNHRAMLAEYFKTVSMNGHLQALTEQLLQNGLPDISASHVSTWGIPVSLPGVQGQVIYEWLEMAAGYLFIAGTLESTGGWESFWKDPKAVTVQCFGFDNSFFYTAFIPAVMKAYDSGIVLPKAFLSNEFYQLEGLKFSTSRNHAIWGDEVLESIPADVIRFYLCHTRPENEQSNFSLAEFKQTVSGMLVNRWERWLNELQIRAQESESFGAAESLLPAQAAFLKRLESLKNEMTVHYSAETFSLLNATRALDRLVFEADQFGKAAHFLKAVPSLQANWRASVVVELTALATLARMAAPILPNFSVKVLSALGLRELPWNEPVVLVGSAQIGKFSSDDFSQALKAIEAFARYSRYAEK